MLKEGSSDAATDRPVRYKAKTLYEPTEALRELELPIIAWSNSKWRSNSDEARLLYGMGLKRHPDVEDILHLASNAGNPSKQKKSLDYFLANFESQYATQYQPIKHNLAFVPVLKEAEKIYVKPLEAYTSSGANILKFATLHPEYQMQAAKFRLATDPKPADLVAALLAAPPKTKEEANPIFAYLAGQASRKLSICVPSLRSIHLQASRLPNTTILASPASFRLKRRRVGHITCMRRVLYTSNLQIAP